MNYSELIKKGQTQAAPRIVLIGVEGVGKSTAGAQMPKPIFLCSENGLVGKQFADVAHAAPKTWEEVLGFLDYLRNEKHGYENLVVDTLDWLEPVLYKFVCARDKKTSVEDYGYGKGYVVACDEFRGMLSRLEALNRSGMGILILAHSQIKAFNNPIGENYDRYEMKVAKQISALTKEWADCVLFARFETYTKKEGLKSKGVGGTARVVHTTHCAAWDAKNRYSLPEILPLDMGEIMAAISAGAGDDTSALIAEINELIPSLDEKKAKITLEWLSKPQTSQALSIMLNKIRATLTTSQE